MKNLQKEIISNKKAKFNLSENAQTDVKEIWLYISEKNPISADVLIEDLFRKFQLLARNPELGKNKDRFFLNLKSFPLKNYLIFYVPNDNGIEIFRVIHSSRNIDSIFEDFFDGLK